MSATARDLTDASLQATIHYESPSDPGPEGNDPMSKSPDKTGQRYTYASGARPLDGFTIKRAIGRGGFGEVYYATSDAGKEVALKLITRNLEVERRGVVQCMNLKSPNLVAIHDLKQNEDGDTFVVMEYVAGPSLAQILMQHPAGLPPGRDPDVDEGARRRRGVPPRSRDRPPRPQARQPLPGRGRGQDRRLRAVQGHHQPEPRAGAFRVRGDVPLHGARDLDGQVSQAHRRVRDRRDPARDGHRPRPVRRRERGRGADEAPHQPAEPGRVARTVQGDRGPRHGQGPESSPRQGDRPAPARRRPERASRAVHRR